MTMNEGGPEGNGMSVLAAGAGLAPVIWALRKLVWEP